MTLNLRQRIGLRIVFAAGVFLVVASPLLLGVAGYRSWQAGMSSSGPPSRGPSPSHRFRRGSSWSEEVPLIITRLPSNTNTQSMVRRTRMENDRCFNLKTRSTQRQPGSYRCAILSATRLPFTILPKTSLGRPGKWSDCRTGRVLCHPHHWIGRWRRLDHREQNRCPEA